MDPHGKDPQPRREERNYTREERAALAAAVARRAPLRCPVCGAAVIPGAVIPSLEVPYVRRRLLLVCSGCGRSAAVENTGGGYAGAGSA